MPSSVIPPREAVSDLERTVIVRVSRRVIPLVFIAYFIAYIDRTNVGFAALRMNEEVGLTPYAYGWGAGIFFLGYFFFQVPSNLFLDRLGARAWIAWIMAAWGIVSGCMAFVVGPKSFIALRFLLGVAESGLFPGVILYFTYWYPSNYRSRIVAAFFLAAPLSVAVGSAVSGAILQLDGFMGVAGWKWMFLLEALPAVVLSVVVLRYMTNRPENATWLDPVQKQWLQDRMAAERQTLAAVARSRTIDALTDRRVLIIASIYFAVTATNYGFSFFLPQVVARFGYSYFKTGLATAIPYAVATVGMLLIGHSSDRRGERRLHLCMACLLAGTGLVCINLVSSPFLSLVAMSATAVGIYGAIPLLWSVPPTFLVGTAIAAGIGLINGLGNLGGFVGPYVVGAIRNATPSFTAAFYFLAGCAFVGAVITWILLPVGRTGTKPSSS